MRPIFGLAFFGLMALAMGLLWASEEEDVRQDVERQLQTKEAEQQDAARLQRETKELADQVRRNEQERAEKLRAISAEDREKLAAALRDRLKNLPKSRGELQSKLSADHPQTKAIYRELEVLRDELRELTAKDPRPEQTLEQELADLREQLDTQAEYRDKLAKHLAASHPTLLESQEKLSVLQKLIQEKERALEMPRERHAERDRAAHEIEHLRAAAEHLQQAGMQELAQELRRRAEDLQKELHHPSDPTPERAAIGQLQEQMRDMQAAMKKLHEELAELREQTPKAKE